MQIHFSKVTKHTYKNGFVFRTSRQINRKQNVTLLDQKPVQQIGKQLLPKGREIGGDLKI